MALLVLLAVVLATSLWEIKTTVEGRPLNPSASNPLTWGPWMWAVVLLAFLTPAWLGRVHRNAEAMSGSHITGSPAWTAGIWFVPFVGGFFAARAVRQVWERSGATRTPFARTWAVLWSLAQLTMLTTVIVGLPSYSAARKSLGRPPFTAAQEAILREVFRQHVWGFVVAFDLLTAGAAICMGIAIVDLERVQRRQLHDGGQLPRNPNVKGQSSR